VISVLSSSPSGHGSDQPSDLVIGVRQETGEDLHHPAEQAACRQRQRSVPPEAAMSCRVVRIVAQQPGVCGSDAGFLQSCAPLLPICVPAIAECARAVVL